MLLSDQANRLTTLGLLGMDRSQYCCSRIQGREIRTHKQLSADKNRVCPWRLIRSVARPHSPIETIQQNSYIVKGEREMAVSLSQGTYHQVMENQLNSSSSKLPLDLDFTCLFPRQVL